MEKRHANHGRDHLPTGSDPIPGLTSSSGGGRFDIKLFKDDDVVVASAVNPDDYFWFELDDDLDQTTLTSVVLFISTKSSSGIIRCDVTRWSPDPDGAGSSFFVTRPRIDVGDFTSRTSGTPAVISGPTCDAGDFISVQVDDAGTNAKGLGIILVFA